METSRMLFGWSARALTVGWATPAGQWRTCLLLLACVGCSRALPENADQPTRGQGQTASPSGKQAAFQFTPALLERHNRAVALMQQYDFDKARLILDQIVTEYPQWTAARVDLAIATLNRGQKGDYEHAAEILAQVLKAHPDNIRAAFCQALLHRFFGNTEAALPLLRQVAEADPQDGYVAYYIGQCLTEMSQLEEAYAQFCRAEEIDPYLRSAYYEAFRTAQRLGAADEAKQHLEQFQKLMQSPQARLAEIKYTRMGPKAEVRPVQVERPPVVAARGARIRRGQASDDRVRPALSVASAAGGPAAPVHYRV